MKPGVKPLLPELQRESRAFLELFASVELKPDLVRLKIFDAAKLGHTSLRLPIPTHLDVRTTAAAAALVEWCKQSNLTITWESRTGDTSDGRRMTTHEPEISW